MPETLHRSEQAETARPLDHEDGTADDADDAVTDWRHEVQTFAAQMQQELAAILSALTLSDDSPLDDRQEPPRPEQRLNLGDLRSMHAASTDDESTMTDASAFGVRSSAFGMSVDRLARTSNAEERTPDSSLRNSPSGETTDDAGMGASHDRADDTDRLAALKRRLAAKLQTETDVAGTNEGVQQQCRTAAGADKEAP